MIRHLPYFAVVAEEQHFQRAAERLRITQSALSRRIQLLEDELGVKLFERLARGIRLTPAGESFYNDVRKVQLDLDQARTRARNIALGQLGRVDVAIAPGPVSHPIVSRMFRTLRERRPALQINMKMIYSEEQIGALQSQLVDVGILYKVTSEKWLTYTPIASDRLTIAIPADHPLATKPSLKLEDLEDQPMIWPTRSHSPHLHDRLLATMYNRGISPRIEVEVHSTESTISIVAMGVALGFISQSLAYLAPPSVVVRDIEDCAIELPLCMAWRSNNGSPILEHFASALAHTLETETATQALAPARLGGRRRA
jgi:DNA-binding transcriptional LysR family regulator